MYNNDFYEFENHTGLLMLRKFTRLFLCSMQINGLILCCRNFRAETRREKIKIRPELNGSGRNLLVLIVGRCSAYAPQGFARTFGSRPLR